MRHWDRLRLTCYVRSGRGCFASSFAAVTRASNPRASSGHGYICRYILTTQGKALWNPQIHVGGKAAKV